MTPLGPTQSVKTHFVKRLLNSHKIQPKPQRSVYLYKRWQPLYDKIQESNQNLEFIQGINDDLDNYSFFNTKINNLIILDKQMSKASQDPKISDLFIEGSHHFSLSLINLAQDLFPQGKNAVTQGQNVFCFERVLYLYL